MKFSTPQLMMGGSHKYSISPEEYIFAALNIYLVYKKGILSLICVVEHSIFDKSMNHDVHSFLPFPTPFETMFLSFHTPF